jgi:DNA-binding beta-propeller fold protein YncE
LGIAGGAVWVVDDVDGSVRKIDPATNMLAATVTLGRGASWFADDGTSLVAANRIDGSITPLDPTAAVAGPSIDGAAGPLDGTVVGERAYIPDGSARTMLEIDLTASRLAIVDRLDGAINPFVAEVAFGDVWVLDYGGKRIWRIHATP